MISGALLQAIAFYAFAASDGAVVLAPPFYPPSTLRWFDRSGKQIGALGEAAPSATHRLSPDGRKVAWVRLNTGKGTSEIWLYDVAAGNGSKFVFNPPAYYDSPVWSADGSRVVYWTDRRSLQKSSDLWMKALDGSTETLFVLNNDFNIPADWSRDGRTIAINKIPEKGRRNNEIWTVDAADPKQQTSFETEAPYQGHPRFSPDGKWVAFDSIESGTSEIYVRPFPGPGGKRKVSSSGGGIPQWRADGKELYYASNDNKLMAVPVRFEPTFQAGAPAVLFTIPGSGQGSVYEATADGQRFLVNTSDAAALGGAPIDLLVNWTALLSRSEAAR